MAAAHPARQCPCGQLQERSSSGVESLSTRQAYATVYEQTYAQPVENSRWSALNQHQAEAVHSLVLPALGAEDHEHGGPARRAAVQRCASRMGCSGGDSAKVSWLATRSRQCRDSCFEVATSTNATHPGSATRTCLQRAINRQHRYQEMMQLAAETSPRIAWSVRTVDSASTVLAAPVAHRIERSAPDRKAGGSIPSRRTTLPNSDRLRFGPFSPSGVVMFGHGSVTGRRRLGRPEIAGS
jgi:hypothetical protein